MTDEPPGEIRDSSDSAGKEWGRCRTCNGLVVYRDRATGEYHSADHSLHQHPPLDFIPDPSAALQEHPMRIEANEGSGSFVPKASIGPEVNPCGFIIIEREEWLASETTYLYGDRETEVDGRTEKNEGLEPVIVYNKDGKRHRKLLQGAIFTIAGKALRPKAKTLGTVGLNTLMSLEAARRFLSGETVRPHDWYYEIQKGLAPFSNLDFDKRLYDVVACIIMASYFYDLFGVFPIITIFGTFATGKGRLLSCMILMGHRGMAEVDPSDASFFRSIEAWKPFLGIDEFYEMGPRIEKLLRSSYKKGAKVPRMEKSKGGIFYLTLFDTFSKVAVAGDQQPPANILQKGIMITMRKMPDPNPLGQDPTAEDFEEARTKGYIARLTWPPDVKEASDKLSAKNLGLSGRDLEVWKPALTIASMLGGKTEENVLNFAKESRAAIAEESYEELKELLEGIYEIIREKSGDFPVKFTPKQLHDRIWEKLKADYRVTKEKQEVQGEVSEKYDYDTRRFEGVYRNERIGRTYLQQLGLKGTRKERGTVYEIADAKTFHSMVIRYHPGFPDEAEDYSKLILTSKLLPEPPEPSADSNLNRKRESPGLTDREKADSKLPAEEGNCQHLTAEATHGNDHAGSSGSSGGLSEVSPRKAGRKP
jgi:hypothetical protein